MIFVAGKCQNCRKYYELPRQDDKAHAFFTLQDDGLIRLAILCVNYPTCEERRRDAAAA